MPKRRPQPAAGGRAYDFVKAAILAGGYKPETFLTEGEIAMRLGLSRTPVREALLRLEVEGLVSLHPKKGAPVRSPSAQEVAELFEARGVLESFAAGRAWPY